MPSSASAEALEIIRRARSAFDATLSNRIIVCGGSSVTLDAETVGPLHTRNLDHAFVVTENGTGLGMQVPKGHMALGSIDENFAGDLRGRMNPAVTLQDGNCTPLQARTTHTKSMHRRGTQRRLRTASKLQRHLPGVRNEPASIVP